MANGSSSNVGVPIAIFLAGVVIAGAILVSNGYFENTSKSPAKEEQARAKPQEGSNLPSGETGSGEEVLGEEIEEAIGVSEDDDPSKGSEDAPVVMIEFSDFQCPFCKRFFDETYGTILSGYVETGKVRYVFRDFPLGFHANAQKAAEAAECADDQGKFWEYHDTLFENQQKWESLSDPADEFNLYAENLGLKVTDFDACLNSGKYTDEIKKDYNDGVAAGINGTPGFIINGKLLVGAQPFSAFKQLIDSELNK